MSVSARQGTLIGAGTAAALALAAGVAVTTAPPTVGVPTAPAVVQLGLPLARLAMDAAAVVATGLAVLPLLLATSRPKESAPVLLAARRAAVVVGALWVLGTAVSLWLASAELAGQGLDVGSGTVLGYAARSNGGHALLVTGCAALAFTVLAAVGLRAPNAVPAGLPLIAALLGLLPVPLTGHAADGPLRELTVLAISLHTVAAAGWLGGLGAVFALASARRALLAAALPRFSALAGICLGTVAVSGLAMVSARLADLPGGSVLSALFETGYGWIVLAKLACLLAVAGLGGYARTRLLPGVSRHRRTATRAWVSAELVVLSVALGLAAALSRASVG